MRCIAGYHAAVIGYGATGSGKTYTMQGDGKGQPGLIQVTAAPPPPSRG